MTLSQSIVSNVGSNWNPFTRTPAPSLLPLREPSTETGEAKSILDRFYTQRGSQRDLEPQSRGSNSSAQAHCTITKSSSYPATCPDTACERAISSPSTIKTRYRPGRTERQLEAGDGEVTTRMSGMRKKAWKPSMCLISSV